MTRRRKYLIGAGVLGGNLLAWAYFRFCYFVDFEPTDLWQAQALLWQGMLLFDTLLVVWFYTEAAWRQVDLGLVQRSDLNKPIVVSAGADWLFRIRNVGPGVSVNVYLVVPMEPHQPRVHEIGALAAGDEARPPGCYFMVGQAPVNHVVVAEALYTRTQQWSASLNVIRNGQIVVRLAEFATAPERTSFRQFLDTHWSGLFGQLCGFAKEIEEVK